jgi:hypothetical protein
LRNHTIAQLALEETKVAKILIKDGRVKPGRLIFALGLRRCQSASKFDPVDGGRGRRCGSSARRSSSVAAGCRAREFSPGHWPSFAACTRNAAWDRDSRIVAFRLTLRIRLFHIADGRARRGHRQPTRTPQFAAPLRMRRPVWRISSWRLYGCRPSRRHRLAHEAYDS